jgi:hypothetical protein
MGPNDRFLVVNAQGKLYIACTDELYLEPDGTLLCTFGGDEPLPAFFIAEETSAVE